MDYVFLFFLSTGFAKGVFHSLKTSVKSLLSLVICVVIFSLVFIPLKNLIFSFQPFKGEFISFLTNSFSSIKDLSIAHDSKENLFLAIENGDYPQLVKNILFKFGESATALSVGGIIAESIYEILFVIVLGIVLFILLSLGVNVLLSFLFIKTRGGGGLFVTKRFLSGFLGGARGVVIFLIIETTLLAFGEVLSLGFIQDFVLSSAVGQVGREIFQSSASILAEGLF